MSKEQFIAAINKSYTTSLPSIYLGAGVLKGEIIADAKVNLPLRMMNRHGLVTGQCKQNRVTHVSTFPCHVFSLGLR